MSFNKTPMGFQLDFPNGWTASVQWGPGNYCTNRDMQANPFKDDIKFLQSETAEIAAWVTDLRTTSTTDGWYKFEDGQEVQGWQNMGQVMEFLNMVSSFPSTSFTTTKVLTAEDVRVASKKWKPILKDWGIDY
jgi:hypothetical protein